MVSQGLNSVLGKRVHVSYHLCIHVHHTLGRVVRTAPNFGKHALLFSYYKEKNDILAIICSVISLSFSNMPFLENIG